MDKRIYRITQRQWKYHKELCRRYDHTVDEYARQLEMEDHADERLLKVADGLLLAIDRAERTWGH